MKLNDLGNDDDGDSWHKLKREVEADTSNECERLRKLTERVLDGFIYRLVRECKGKEKMIIEKKGTKHCPESGTLSAVEKEDYVKQKKLKAADNGEKQKTNSNNQKTGQGTMLKLTALGLEPPPDMPRQFKNYIENLGGTEIKLVIQKFIQVTDLKESQNSMSMPLKQVRSEFWNEDEEEKLNRKEAIEIVFVEPRPEVSKLKLNKWQVGPNSWSYVLNGSWHRNIVKNDDNGLKPMGVVQVWSFRVGPKSQLGFALIKVRDGEDGHVIN